MIDTQEKLDKFVHIMRNVCMSTMLEVEHKRHEQSGDPIAKFSKVVYEVMNKANMKHLQELFGLPVTEEE